MTNDKSPHSHRRFGIRNKMVLSFGILFAVTIIIVNAVSMFGIPFTPFRGSYGIESAGAMGDLDLVAGLKQERLQVWISERKGNMQMIAHCEKMAKSIRGLRQVIALRNLTPNQPTFKNSMQRDQNYSILRKELLLMLEIYPEYNTLCLIDAQRGFCIVSTDTAHLGEDVSRKRFIREAVDGIHGEAVDLELQATSQKPTIVFTRLIKDAAEEPMAVLVAHVDADAFVRPMLYVGEELGKSDEVILLDERARPLVTLKSPMANGEQARMLVDSIATQDAALVTHGKDGVIATNDYRGVPVFAAYRFIQIAPNRGMGLILKRDQAEIVRSIWRRIGYSLIVAFCGLLLALGLTALNAARISEPIIKLSNTARAVEAGDLTARALPTTNDEVGALATVFNSMLNRVQQWHAELEKEVEARSKALKKINRELEERIVQHERAENDLRESKEFAEKLINLMQDGFAVFDTKGVHTSVNPSLCRMTGFTAKELLGKGPPHPYWPEEDREKFQAIFEETHPTKPREFELMMKRKDGTLFPALISPSQTKDAQGNVNYYFASIKDISERKRVLEALRQSEEKYRLHFEYASDIIYSIDRNMRLLSVSPSIEKVLGYKPEDLVGKLITELNIIAPDHLEAFARDLKQIQAGKQVPTPIYEFLSRTGERRFGEINSAPLYRNQQIIGVVSVARDITAHVRTDEELKRSNRALRIISNCNMTLVRATKEKELLTEICRWITEIGGYMLAWVGYAEEDEERTISIAAHTGKKIQHIKRQKLTWADNKDGNNPFGIAIRSKTNYMCPNAEKADKDMVVCRELLKHGFKSLMVLPLIYGDKILGTLNVHSADTEVFNEREINLLQEIADDLSYGIKALRAHIARDEASEALELSYEKLRKTLEETVNALASASEKRDPYTAGHQRSVTQLACAIAEEMKMTEEQVEGIRIAGLLHDIGKLSVPAEILSKPGTLSESEFAIIRLHCKIGYDILKTVNFPWPVAQIALEHHERVNGSGYPRGLSGDKALLESRIMAVADVVEAMSSHRPYRPARTIKETLEEVKKNRGILYDAEVVDVCLTIFDKKKFRFKRS
ncbi:MAG: PAS domain S-box protein [candidate division WOR-3 bacterium]|nr:MAG: PAS domain S-box protein [candidate division WOR-3 bacterium]